MARKPCLIIDSNYALQYETGVRARKWSVLKKLLQQQVVGNLQPVAVYMEHVSLRDSAGTKQKRALQQWLMKELIADEVRSSQKMEEAGRACEHFCNAWCSMCN